MKSKPIQLICLLFLILSCQQRQFLEVAKVKTGNVTGTLGTSATASGAITDLGTGISDYGFCWSASGIPTIANSKTSLGAADSLKNFTALLTDLQQGTKYYLAAYAQSGSMEVYGSVVSFTTNDGIITDIDGNLYHTVTIGTQVWMVENLKTTKYNDGTAIPFGIDPGAWNNANTNAAYCFYNNDESTYKNTYGALYNWNAVSTNKLCPSGWHVPTDDEWTILTTFLGGESVAGGKLKEAGLSHWTSPNSGSTNNTGFSALPAGYRSFWGGGFGGIGDYCTYWSSSSGFNVSSAWIRDLNYNDATVSRSQTYYFFGFSVRCTMD